jgi:hypothetical protein
MRSLSTAYGAFGAFGVSEDDPELGQAMKLMRVAVNWQEKTPPWLVGVDEPMIDELEDALAKGDMPAGSFAPGAKRCTAHAEFDKIDAVPLGAVDGYRVATERVHGQALRALWPGQKLAVACWFAPDGKAVARCGEPAVHIGASLLSSDAGMKDFVAWDFRGAKEEQSYALVSGLSGKVLLTSSTSLSENGWARTDGTQVVFSHAKLVAVQNGEAKDLPLPPSVAADRKWMIVRPGWLLWGSDAQAFGAAWDDRAGGFGAAVDIGVIPGRPVVRGCRDANGALVLATVSEESGLADDGNVTVQPVNVRVAFPNGKGGFGRMVSARVRMPWTTSMTDAPDWAAELGCRADGSPRWAWLQNNRVHELSCTRAGCKELTSAPLSFGQLRVVKVGLAPVGDRDVLLAYDGERRGKVQTLLHAIRYRRAPIATIASAPEHVLIADNHYGGLESLWEGVYVFGRGDVGWIAFRADGLLYAFRVGPKGEMAPVQNQ